MLELSESPRAGDLRPRRASSDVAEFSRPPKGKLSMPSSPEQPLPRAVTDEAVSPRRRKVKKKRAKKGEKDDSEEIVDTDLSVHLKQLNSSDSSLATPTITPRTEAETVGVLRVGELFGARAYFAGGKSSVTLGLILFYFQEIDFLC